MPGLLTNAVCQIDVLVYLCEIVQLKRNCLQICDFLWRKFLYSLLGLHDLLWLLHFARLNIYIRIMILIILVDNHCAKKLKGLFGSLWSTLAPFLAFFFFLFFFFFCSTSTSEFSSDRTSILSSFSSIFSSLFSFSSVFSFSFCSCSFSISKG